ncbi:MAG TPA: efflux RND transporter periplasmic adaptor subunit [Candidatus Eisenbacteria bacterium]
MKAKAWIWIAAGAVVLVALIGIAVVRGGKGRTQAVQYARVRQEDITSRVRAPGKIEPRTQVKVSADIMGKIVKLAVKEGDAVRQGQLMLQLDDTQYRSAYDQAQAMLSSAHSRLKDAQAAAKLAEATYTRQSALWNQKVLSEAEWDQANNAIDSARNAVTTAREEVSRSEAALAGAADNLRKTRFQAPFDGVVSALNVEQGEIVITGTMNNPGTEILTVSDLSRMLVKADVDETDVVDMKLGQKAKITVDALPDTSFAGTVVEIGNTAKRSVVSTSEGQTNFEVKVVFDTQVPQVRPGMTADVEIQTGTHPQTTGVPIQAVVVRTERELARAGKTGKAVSRTRADRPRSAAKDIAFAADEDTVGRKDKEITGIFVVRDGVAKFVPVRTGIASDTDLEVFGDFKVGEIVVAGPYKALRELKPETRVKQETAGARAKK